MKEVINEDDKIYLNTIYDRVPIFAKRENKLAGMIVHEKDKGWILRTGGANGCSGHHNEKKRCIQSAERLGYTFFIE